MYDTLLRLWKQNKLNETQLMNAVSKGWITEEQRSSILNEPR